MQNNENQSSGSFRKFFRQKGYYVALALCIAAVGVSAYVFVSGVMAEKRELQEPSLSVATKAELPKKTVKTETAALPEAEQVMSSDETVAEAAASVRVRPVSGEEQAGYCMDRLSFNETTQDWRTHDGVDLCAVSGEPVLAASGGTVSAVYDDEYFGTTVSIAHEDGFVTTYSNLAPMPTVSVGQAVEAGTVIGSVGTSALLEITQQPHLHFAVSCNGESVDPSDFFA